MVSTVVWVVLEAPGLKAPTVTPCNFMQFRKAANAELFAPFGPRALGLETCARLKSLLETRVVAEASGTRRRLPTGAGGRSLAGRGRPAESTRGRSATIRPLRQRDAVLGEAGLECRCRLRSGG